jgi:hypothetical protein
MKENCAPRQALNEQSSKKIIHIEDSSVGSLNKSMIKVNSSHLKEETNQMIRKCASSGKLTKQSTALAEYRRRK